MVKAHPHEASSHGKGPPRTTVRGAGVGGERAGGGGGVHLVELGEPVSLAAAGGVDLFLDHGEHAARPPRQHGHARLVVHVLDVLHLGVRVGVACVG